MHEDPTARCCVIIICNNEAIYWGGGIVHFIQIGFCLGWVIFEWNYFLFCLFLIKSTSTVESSCPSGLLHIMAKLPKAISL